MFYCQLLIYEVLRGPEVDSRYAFHHPASLLISCCCPLFYQYDDGLYGSMENPYDPLGRQMQSLTHGAHMNHGPSMHQYHGNHVMSNHVMGSVPDVHKRDKDAIYG